MATMPQNPTMAVSGPLPPVEDAPHASPTLPAHGRPLPQADPILYWNAVALEANRISHTNGAGEHEGPPLSTRALAIVHLAMHDAYAAMSGFPTELPTYLDKTALTVPTLDAAITQDVAAAAAVAGAAHRSLCVLFPSQQAFFDLALNGTGDLVPDSRKFGEMVADKILMLRDDDPGAEATGYGAEKGRFFHRVDPDNPGQGYHAPYYGERAKPFAITKSHTLRDPRTLANYDKALREVRARGIAPELMGTLPAGMQGRTADETLRGIYWGYDGAAGLGTPPRLYNQIVRCVAVAQGNSVAQNARLFALINVAMADAGIVAWREKYDHDFWRPILGIREHDKSTGPASTVVDANGTTNPVPDNAITDDCDPGWLPLGAPKTNATGSKNFTPPFPAYPSGHATFGAAAFHMTRLFYGVPAGDTKPDNLFQVPMSMASTTVEAGMESAHNGEITGNGQVASNGHAQNGGMGTLPLIKELEFVSDEFNGINKDNRGTVRPRHVRRFPGGLWQMILENGLSRVDLGVHWIFDAFGFKVDQDGKLQPDLTQKDVGGVPLGLAIAEDIFNSGMQPSPLAPAMMTAERAADAVESAPVRGGSWRDKVNYLQ